MIAQGRSGRTGHRKSSGIVRIEVKLSRSIVTNRVANDPVLNMNLIESLSAQNIFCHLHLFGVAEDDYETLM
jgi:hypothetical protein